MEDRPAELLQPHEAGPGLRLGFDASGRTGGLQGERLEYGFASKLAASPPKIFSFEKLKHVLPFCSPPDDLQQSACTTYTIGL